MGQGASLRVFVPVIDIGSDGPQAVLGVGPALAAHARRKGLTHILGALRMWEVGLDEDRDCRSEGMSPVRPIVPEPAGCAVPPASRTVISRSCGQYNMHLLTEELVRAGEGVEFRRAFTRCTISMLGSTVTMPGKGLYGISTSGNSSLTQQSGLAGLGPLGIHQLKVRAVTMSDSMPRLGAAWFHPCVLASMSRIVMAILSPATAPAMPTGPASWCSVLMCLVFLSKSKLHEVQEVFL